MLFPSHSEYHVAVFFFAFFFSKTFLDVFLFKKACRPLYLSPRHPSWFIILFFFVGKKLWKWKLKAFIVNILFCIQELCTFIKIFLVPDTRLKTRNGAITDSWLILYMVAWVHDLNPHNSCFFVFFMSPTALFELNQYCDRSKYQGCKGLNRR